MKSKFPTLRDGDPLEPWHLNIVYRELERWNKGGGSGGVKFDNKPSGPIWSSILGVGIAIFKTTGTVTARSGTTPGSGNAVQVVGTATTLTDGAAITLRNISGASIPSGKYGFAVRLFGLWWALAWEC